MDEIPDDIIKAAGELSEELSEDVISSASFGDLAADLEVEGSRTVDRLASKIDLRDPELARQELIRGPFPDLATMFAPYVARFVNLLRPDGGAVPQQLPMLRVSSDGIEQLVPIDTANERAAQAVIARNRVTRIYGSPTPDSEAGNVDPEGWDQIAETVPFVDMRPVSEAGRAFFNLFTISFWMGRRSAARTGQSMVNFTVDCSNHGYQLEYWPQFLFTPTVFGGNLTRPVSMLVPINHYHFQGWLNNVVTPDGGLYPADPTNTLVTLKAF